MRPALVRRELQRDGDEDDLTAFVPA